MILNGLLVNPSYVQVLRSLVDIYFGVLVVMEVRFDLPDSYVVFCKFRRKSSKTNIIPL